MRRRPFAVKHAIAAALIGPLFASAALAQDTRPLRLLVWINGDKGYNGLQKVGDAFTALSGVLVLVQHPEGATEKFLAAAAAGRGPDIVCWPHNAAGEWARSGLIVPVQPGRAVRDEIDAAAWRAFTFTGKVWGYPLSIEANGLIYNKALVPRPPATFDEVMAIDKQLARQGRKALLWAYNQSFFTWAILAGPGGFIFGRNAAGELDPAKLGVNNAGALLGAELLERLVREGYMARGARHSEMEAAFSRGQVAMMISGPWAWENARKSGIDFGVAAIPSVAGHPSRPFVGVLGCMISAASKVKDVAREFIEHHLLKVHSLKMISADVPLGTPANKAYFRELSGDPKIVATMANALAGEAIPSIPEMGRFFPAMDAALEAITSGRQSPREALDGAAARMLTR